MDSDTRGKSASSRATAGSSGSISSSFLGLKAELERSKASASSSKRKSSKVDELDTHRRSKKLSSTFLDSSTTSSSKRRSSRADTRSEKLHSSSSSSGSNPTSAQLSAMRANMERKAKIYEQLQAGKFAGFTSDELKEGSIDWERKRAESPPPARSPSPPPTNGEEEQVEWVDEFGRSRTSAISDVPRQFLSHKYGGDLADDQEHDNAIYGPATSFPIFHRERKHEQPNRFNSDFERRHRGAAFYKFSEQEQERQAQLDQLKELRDDTLRRRREASSGASG